MSEKDFYIEKDGTIVRDDNCDNEIVLDKDAERKEYGQLEYEIFSHPDRFSEEELQKKRERFEELKQMLEIKNNVDVIAFSKAKLKLKKKTADNSLLKNALLNLKKNKDAGM